MRNLLVFALPWVLTLVPQAFAQEQEKPQPLKLETLVEIRAGLLELMQYEDNELLYKEKAEQYAATLEEFVGRPVEFALWVSEVKLDSTVLAAPDLISPHLPSSTMPILFWNDTPKAPVQLRYGTSIERILMPNPPGRGQPSLPSTILLPHEGTIALDEAKQLRRGDYLRVTGELAGIVIGSMGRQHSSNLSQLEITFLIRPSSAKCIEPKTDVKQQ